MPPPLFLSRNYSHYCIKIEREIQSPSDYKKEILEIDLFNVLECFLLREEPTKNI
jgi:hypothetical protein